MAMNGKTLGDAIAAIITSPDAPKDMADRIKAQWEAIGAAIVTHIQTNAMVTVQPGIPVATSGSASAQSGMTTGNGAGTIS